MGTTSLYIVRHGQTIWNVEQRMQGRKDSALTELGVQQAEWAAEALRGVQFGAAYASSSPRTMRTAGIITAGRRVDVTPSDALQEIQLGIWEGRLQKELAFKFENHYNAFWKAPHTFRMNGSETLFAVRTRVLAEIERIVAAHPGQNVLIVSHTVAIKLLLAEYEGSKIPQLWESGSYLHPGSISLVRIAGDGRKAVVAFSGDISHWPEHARASAES